MVDYVATWLRDIITVPLLQQLIIASCRAQQLFDSWGTQSNSQPNDSGWLLNFNVFIAPTEMLKAHRLS